MHMWPMNQDRIEEKRARFDGRNLIDSERVRKLEPRRNDERCNGDSDDEIISVIDNQQGWRRPTGSRRTGRRCGYDNDDGIVRIEERRTRPTTSVRWTGLLNRRSLKFTKSIRDPLGLNGLAQPQTQASGYFHRRY